MIGEFDAPGAVANKIAPARVAPVGRWVGETFGGPVVNPKSALPGVQI